MAKTDKANKKAARERDFGRYVTFVLCQPKLAKYGMTEYSDYTGKVQGFYEQKDKQGNPIPKRWSWTFNNRQVHVHEDYKDIFGTSAVEFLRNAPDCKDSPNGSYVEENGKDIQVGYFFKELNDEADALVLMGEAELKLKAQNVAAALKGQDLIDVAAAIGAFNLKPGMMKTRVYHYASSLPKAFLELIEDANFKNRSFLKRLVNAEIVKVKGTLHTWEGQALGGDENAAVATIQNDVEMRKALEASLKRFGG